MVIPRTPSRFDRHYGTRRAKRWRDVCLVLLGISVLVLAVVGLDPLFSHEPLKTGRVLLIGLLATIFLALGLSFHMRYKSRE